ncbi:MAG TPA: LuxR C-terminal-related transcriptional regulator, partial [Puia sp.]|nr:LuxR C-terminal-related transcriptional regulator [Puia sp.]
LIVKSKFEAQKKTPAALFTDREREIIRLICRQHTAQEIGELLFLSKRTVEGYRTRILEKMDVKNTAGVVIFALKHNIVREEEIG